MAQRVARMTCHHDVAGSSPVFGTKLVWPRPRRPLKRVNSFGFCLNCN